MVTELTKTKKTNRTKISLWVDDDVLRRIDGLAKMGGLSRSKLINNMIDELSKTLQACGKVGILQMTVLLRDMSEKLWDWARKLDKKKIDI